MDWITGRPMLTRLAEWVEKGGRDEESVLRGVNITVAGGEYCAVQLVKRSLLINQ